MERRRVQKIAELIGRLNTCGSSRDLAARELREIVAALVRPFTRRLFNNRNHDEDVIGDVMTMLLEKASDPSFCPHSSYVGYIAKAARNACLNIRCVGWYRYVVTSEDPYSERVDDGASTQEIALNAYELNRFREAMEQLRTRLPAEHEILVMCDLECFSIKDISKDKKCSPHAVKTARNKAIAELRRLLGVDPDREDC